MLDPFGRRPRGCTTRQSCHWEMNDWQVIAVASWQSNYVIGCHVVWVTLCRSGCHSCIYSPVPPSVERVDHRENTCCIPQVSDLAIQVQSSRRSIMEADAQQNFSSRKRQAKSFMNPIRCDTPNLNVSYDPFTP